MIQIKLSIQYIRMIIFPWVKQKKKIHRHLWSQLRKTITRLSTRNSSKGVPCPPPVNGNAKTRHRHFPACSILRARTNDKTRGNSVNRVIWIRLNSVNREFISIDWIASVSVINIEMIGEGSTIKAREKVGNKFWNLIWKGEREGKGERNIHPRPISRCSSYISKSLK